MDSRSFNGREEREPLLKRLCTLNNGLDVDTLLKSKLCRFSNGVEVEPLLKYCSYSYGLDEEPLLKNACGFLSNDLNDEPKSDFPKGQNEPILKNKCRFLNNAVDVECVVHTNHCKSNDDLEKQPLLKSCNGNCDDELENEPLLGSSLCGGQKGKRGLLEPPPDTFFLTQLVVFFTGVTGMLPLTFFLVANDYWMYKFRDVSSATYDLNDKTYFQTMFVSMNSMCTAIPTVLSVFLTAKYGNKIDIRTRYLISLGTLSCLFVIFTALIKVNTDTWQTIFFISSLAVMSAIAFLQPFLNMTNVTFIAKCPPKYLMFNLYGSAAGGVCGSTLQIVSLAIGHNSTQIALIYFSTGTVLMIFTMFLTYMMKYSPVVQFYLKKSAEAHYKPTRTLKDYWEAAKRIWFILVMLVMLTFGMGLGHPNITNLVVSEGYTGTGENLWYDKYFGVTATYFSYDFFQLIGRFFGKGAVTKKNFILFLFLEILLIYVPGFLFWFCNAQPRMHLPVLFHHDYQYMIIMAVYSCSTSVFMTTLGLSIPALAKEKTELAFVLMMGIITLTMTFASFLNPIYIKLL